MKKHLLKRSWSLLLVFAMIFSMLPMQAFAMEGDAADSSGENDVPSVVTEFEEDSLLQLLRDEIAGYMEAYELSLDMPDQILAEVYASLNYEEAMAAFDKAKELMDLAEDLESNEADVLMADQNTQLCLRFYNIMEQSMRPVMFAATQYTPAEGITVSVDHSNIAEGSIEEVSDGKLTVTAKIGKSTGCGSNVVYAVDTVTIMIYNDSETTGNLVFNYASEGCLAQENEFKIDGEAVTSASGAFSKLVEKGTSVTISFKTSALGTADSILELFDFAVLPLRESVNLTVGYDAELGSVTANDAAVADGSIMEITNDTVLTATPNSGTAFVAWVDENGKVLSRATEYTVFLTDDQTVNAIFSRVSDVPWFDPGDGYLYHDLAEAVTKGDKVVVACDGTLPAGDYTIPSGVTLLIPFDDANTLYTDKPLGDNATYTKPTAYRTLTLASGANLTVEGSMSLSAKHHAASGGSQNSGSPKGKVSFVNMQGDSSIKVANGGKLYAWGYITGSGSVYAESGAEVFENFQLNDFRGGTATTKMGDGVFPMSQYYIQNIEVPLTIESGATESCYTSIYMSSSTWGAGVAFFGQSGAMFNLTSGSVTKYYDGSKDRLVVSLDGDMRIDPMSLKISTISIKSQNYELPINSNITVDIQSGSSVVIAQDLALLPGAVINVEENATCTLETGVSVYIYDADQWGGYCAPSNKTLIPVGYAPGKAYTRTDADLVDAEIYVNGTMDASAGFAYTTEGGANIHSSESGKIITTPGTDTFTQQVNQGASSAITYVDIPVTPARLKNADGTYTETSGVSGTYDYENGIWVKTCNHLWTETSRTEAACETTGIVYYSCICGETKTEEIPALGHEWGEGVITVEPTYTTEGEAVYTCTRCEATKTEKIPPLQHEHVQEIIPAVPATCYSTGLTQGIKCSLCGEILVEQQIAEMIPHTLEHVEAKKPTWNSNGWEAFDYCTVENCGYTTQVTIPALGEPEIDNYEEFIANLSYLEAIAQEYVKQNPGKDPLALVIKYIRTGVDRYNSGSWEIMAGYEDADFARFVRYAEDQINQQFDSSDQYIKVTGLKNLTEFALPNGDWTDIGHMFGTMDITYHNKNSQNHADVGGWAGDLVDLMSITDWYYYAEGSTQLVPPENFDLEIMVKQISDTCLLKELDSGFGLTDYYGDSDAFCVMNELMRTGYNPGRLTSVMTEYFTEKLSDQQRAESLLQDRFGGASTRSQVRDAVFSAYIGNKTLATLEGTREFLNNDSTYLNTLRKAACYAFADYLCRTAGDYAETPEDSLYDVFNTETSTLAPGITQEIKYATSADGKQMVYYIATADINRDDVNVYANYANADPSLGWEMSRVLDQANAAQSKYGDPNSEYYIPNYNVIVSTNSDGFNMSTGEPGGLLIMDGKEYHGVNSSGFFGITKDGKAIIGTMAEYNNIYRGQLAEAVGGFGTTLVKDGKISVSKNDNYYTSRASRTAVGITKSGKVVLMVLDGRQEPFSCGGSMQEIAQIMLEAGCVHAINLDGGGSTTFVARQEGDTELSVVNRPSDGFQRSVSSTLMFVSTAPSSTAFDHAVLEADYSYATLNTPVKITAVGVSATGNSAELPEGAVWTVGNDLWGSITEDGVFTGLRPGSVDVYLKLGDDVIGQMTMNIVTPDTIYFTRSAMDAVYGQTITLPVAALYEGKKVAINENDITISLSNAGAGSARGFQFTVSQTTTLKNVRVTAALANNAEIKGSLTVNLYKQGENTFDFDKATGGDRLLAFDRQVTNSTTEDGITYTAVDTNEDMVTSYIFAMDMSQIPIPDQLKDLTYMLPGADLTDASAWGFLLQLSQRVSDMTYVNAVLKFDKRFDVDYSELKIINDYFELTDSIFDEETNTLTLTLHWIKQSQSIKPETANPLCIVNGIKLTPKADVDWGAKNQIHAENSGSITYRIYLRASALVSFGNNPENQKIYGLYSYHNPNDPSDAGAYFESLYKSYTDSYTLCNAAKNGWVVEDNGFAYYVDGERLTGIQKVDGFYYNFGETGINKGQVKYTGLLKENEKTYYSQAGELTSGWIAAEDGYYYFFSTEEKHAYTGICKFGNQTYTFDNEGRLIRGAFVETDKGTRYYWAGRLMARKWIELEEGTYYANDNGYIVYGNYPVKEDATKPTVWWHFDEETGLRTGLCDGFVQCDGSLYYCENGKWFYGAVAVDEGIIFSGTNGIVKVNGGCYISSSLEYTAGLETGYYWCGEDGYIVANGFATINSETYYFTDYVRAKGFTKIGEDYYFFNASNGKMSCDVTLWVGTNQYGVAPGYYIFQADGTMYVPDPNGEKAIVEENGNLYFTIDGMKQTNGLNELDGEYYYANSNGKLAVNTTVWISNFNDLIDTSSGYFAFDAEGKLIKTGFVTGGGVTYYYNHLERAKGFTKIGEDYYFFNASNGKMYTDATLWVGGNNPYGISAGYYTFQADGTMYIPDPNGEKVIIEENGNLYITIDGMKQTNGLNELDGEYYYANSNGKLAVNMTIWISNFNGLIDSSSGYFAFDAEGKLVKTGFATGGGATYYYDNLERAKGFTKIGEDYYFFNASSGKMYADTTLWVSGSNKYGVAAGSYKFDSDGKMITA